MTKIIPALNQLSLQLMNNIKYGFMLTVFRKIKLKDFHFSVDVLVGLMLFNLLLTAISHFYLISGKSSFNIYALPDWAFGLIMLFISAYIIEKIINSRNVILHFPTILLSVSPIIILISFLIIKFSSVIQEISVWGYSGMYYLMFIWVLVVSFKVIKLVTAMKALPIAMLTLLYSGITLSQQFYLPNQYFWTADYSDYESPYKKINVEKVFYSQNHMIEKEKRRLVRQRPRVRDIYFVGFGSYSSQDVFMKEIFSIKQLFDDRFDTKGRSVALINNPETVDTAPIASISNLSMVLKHIGKLMDRKNDILFLYLTSHGSQNHKLSVDFWPLRLNQIGPKELKTTLDDAGIKWRVIVISACYSGGFIEELKDDFTIVMTSSSAKKQSFGCGSGNEYTYFGKALFDEQLRNTFSITNAFNQAAISIAEREKSENLTPSEPQLYSTKKIIRHLRSVEARLSRRANKRSKTLSAKK